MMDRRAFLGGLGLLGAPLAATAQQTGRVYRIGYVGNSPGTPQVVAFRETFREALRERGWVEGRNTVIEWRSAEGRAERLFGLVAELVRLKMDVILTTGAPATRAAMQATATIPIVTVAISDPVAQGIAGTLARPGGNITGLATLFPELAVKRRGLLKETMPSVSRVEDYRAARIGRVPENRKRGAGGGPGPGRGGSIAGSARAR